MGPLELGSRVLWSPGDAYGSVIGIVTGGPYELSYRSADYAVAIENEGPLAYLIPETELEPLPTTDSMNSLIEWLER